MKFLSSLLALLTLLTCVGASASAQVVPINGVAARVNGEPITLQEVNLAMASQVPQLQKRVNTQAEFDAALESMRAETLQQLIDNKLIIQEFKGRAVNVPTQMIDREVERVVRDNFDNNRKLFLDDLRSSNLTLAGFRRMLEDQLIVREMRRSQLGLPKPASPEDVEKAYRENEAMFRGTGAVRYRNLFVPRQDLATGAGEAAQRQLIDDIRRQVTNGADFAELAKQHSTLLNARNGGANETQRETDLVAWVREPLFNTSVGAMTPVLERPEGFYLYYVEALEPGPLTPLAEVREQVEEMVREESQREDYDEWMARLHAKSDVQVN